MSDVNEVTRMRWKRVVLLLALTTLFVASAAPADAWYGYGGYGRRYYGYRRPGVVIVPSVVFPVGPFWPAYAYPPVVVESPPLVYVQPSAPVYAQPPPPQPYWYYCDNPQGYYPYVPECPGGWRQVVPTPQ